MDLATLRMYLTPLAEGTVWTLALFFCSAFLAVALGLAVCLCRLSRHRALSRAARIYIDIIRGTPLLLQLFYIYYGLPEMGVVINGFVAGVLGLTLNFGAYLAELFRSGIQSVIRANTRRRARWACAAGSGCSASCCRRRYAPSFPRWATTRWC